MEITPTDRLAAEILFGRARVSLRALVALLRPVAPGVASDSVRAAITNAVGALDGAAHALDASDVDSAPPACPLCGTE